LTFLLSKGANKTSQFVTRSTTGLTRIQ